MRERFGKEDANGIVDFHYIQDTKQYESDYVHPTSWTVDFDACDSVSSPSNLKWEVDGDPISETTCRFSHDFPHLGNYVVSLTATTPDDQSSTVQETVTLKDLLIVSIGDSFASGEGAPDKQHDELGGPKWIDKRCHRSAFSGPARAARIIEQADRHTSVTFISFACTGASIEKGLLHEQKRGLHTVQPQLEKVLETIQDRTIDALLISIGGNDISFAKLVTWTIILKHAETSGHTERLAREGLKALPETFDSLKNELDLPEWQTRIARVFISEYPDIVRDETRAFCNRPVVFTKHGPAITTAESEWALTSVIVPLNQIVKEKAIEFGWNYVDGIFSEFGGDSANGVAHGFCACDPWVNLIVDSVNIQGDIRGTIHPNREGHLWYARRLVKALNAKGVTGQTDEPSASPPPRPCPSVAPNNEPPL
jgi:hypothetical protein